jgi:hypothetical protein
MPVDWGLRTVQARTLPATGRYSFALRPRATGTSWRRIYKASDDRRNLNGEYALVRNTGAAAVNLAGWGAVSRYRC